MTKTIRQFALLTVCALTLGLGACNTMAGAGQDIEEGGEAVQDAAY